MLWSTDTGDAATDLLQMAEEEIPTSPADQ